MVGAVWVLLQPLGFPVTFHSCSEGITHVRQACVTFFRITCVKGQFFPTKSSTLFPVTLKWSPMAKPPLTCTYTSLYCTYISLHIKPFDSKLIWKSVVNWNSSC